MLHVNLIGAQQRERQALSKVRAVCLVIGIAVIAGAALLALPAVLASKQNRDEIDKVKETIAKSEETAEQVRKMEAQAAELRPVRKMVREAQQSSIDWMRLLMILQRDMPEGVWLERIESRFSEQDLRHELQIQGKALSMVDLAEALDNLGRTGPIANAALVQSNSTGGDEETGEIEVFDFTLRAELRFAIGEYVH